MGDIGVVPAGPTLHPWRALIKTAIPPKPDNVPLRVISKLVTASLSLVVARRLTAIRLSAQVGLDVAIGPRQLVRPPSRQTCLKRPSLPSKAVVIVLQTRIATRLIAMQPATLTALRPSTATTVIEIKTIVSPSSPS